MRELAILGSKIVCDPLANHECVTDSPRKSASLFIGCRNTSVRLAETLQKLPCKASFWAALYIMLKISRHIQLGI